ncbi:MAG: hypothetical protein PHN38_08675 [Sulfurospirillaceae bacterium]|nr:hypothetical protein [Sulfurospirillaceae bacterium]
MKLEDMVLSTLAEVEETIKIKETVVANAKESIEDMSLSDIENALCKDDFVAQVASSDTSLEEEKYFCESLRERILVLFEGFQSPNNRNIEAKIDLTLNFLEYLLATIDERLETLSATKK